MSATHDNDSDSSSEAIIELESVHEVSDASSTTSKAKVPLLSRSREIIAIPTIRTNREWIDLVLVLLTLLWTETARGIVMPTQAEYVDEVGEINRKFMCVLIRRLASRRWSIFGLCCCNFQCWQICFHNHPRLRLQSFQISQYSIILRWRQVLLRIWHLEKLF